MLTISTATSFLESVDPIDALHCFKKGGFSTLSADFWQYAKPGRMLSGDNWCEEVARYKDAAKALGISFYQTHGTTLTGKKWGDPSLAEEEAHVWKMNERAIEASAMLGAKWVVMHPYNLPLDPIYSSKKALEKNLSYLAPFIELAKKHGVGIAVENMVDFGGNRRRYCGGDPDELIELVDTIHDPSVGICIDTGHANLSGIHSGEFIRLAGSRLKCTHINDNARDGDRHLPPYYGTVDWKDTVQALRDVHFEGDFSLELAPYRFPSEARDTVCRFTHDLAVDLLK